MVLCADCMLVFPRSHSAGFVDGCFNVQIGWKSLFHPPKKGRRFFQDTLDFASPIDVPAKEAFIRNISLTFQNCKEVISQMVMGSLGHRYTSDRH